jgi:hypothetical protein
VAFDLATVLNSRHERRRFFFTTFIVVAISVIVTLIIAKFSPSGIIWSTFNGILISIAASAYSASFSAMYFWYFFADPNEKVAQSYIFPQDISLTLETIANSATDYKIFVRTGRHFRAKILPILIERARTNRSPIRLEVVLLDFREDAVCERYANYRKTSSFDGALWDKFYVQSEVLATIIAVAKATNEHSGLIRVDLYLSRRLSTFRIEGSANQLIVTREDPKDAASRYNLEQSEFAAYLTEFSWIRDEADHVPADRPGALSASLTELFGEGTVPSKLAEAAQGALYARSPYVR